MDKAHRAIEGARVLLATGDTEGACSRAYYAMYDAAHAALIATGHETIGTIIRTHHSVIARFGERLVLTGLVDASFGRAFNKVQDIRLLADYSAEPPPIDQAKWAVEQAVAFVALMRSIAMGIR